MPNSGMIGVDVGGTFTDNVAIEDGRITATKVRTRTNIESSVLEGAEALGVESKAIFNHASTTGLNAVITRNLPKMAYLTTLGHRDVLDMARAWRPREALTDANWRRSFGDATAPLVPRYLRRGVMERITTEGAELIPLDEEQAREELEVLKRCDVQGVAICLINSYVNSEHEIRLRELVREVLGDIPCSISAEVSPLAKEYMRASTTVIDAFMKEIFEKYSTRLHDGLLNLGYEKTLNFADCAATLSPIDFAIRRPHRLIFSGPAAGTMSSARFGGFMGEGNFICCDVGGTSTDISAVTDGNPIVNTNFEVEFDLVVNTLANEVKTIGAGGGSIVSVGQGGQLRVGPESAGANPGPACYPNGGTDPTLTDACLLGGLLSEEVLLGDSTKLDKGRAERAFSSLKTNLRTEECIEFAYRLGLNNIGEGIINIAVEHGIDPRDYAIMAYGAAGPMLIPGVLDLVHAKSVVVPPYPGVFSALGLLSSDLVYADSESAYVVLTEDTADSINEVYETMEKRLLDHISASRDEVSVVRTFDGRYAGQTWDTPLISVPSGKITPEATQKMIANFHDAHEQRWGNRFSLPVEGVTYRLQVIVPVDKVSYEPIERGNGQAESTGKTTLKYLGYGEVDALEYRREGLRYGDVVEGPAVIREDSATTQICEGQIAEVGEYGQITITQKD